MPEQKPENLIPNEAIPNLVEFPVSPSSPESFKADDGSKGSFTESPTDLEVEDETAKVASGIGLNTDSTPHDNLVNLAKYLSFKNRETASEAVVKEMNDPNFDLSNAYDLTADLEGISKLDEQDLSQVA